MATKALRVMQMTPEKVNAYVLYQSYEALAIVYLEQNRMGDAITSLEESRKRLPIYHAALTEKLALVLGHLVTLVGGVLTSTSWLTVSVALLVAGLPQTLLTSMV